MTTIEKSYSELTKISDFGERIKYLLLDGVIGEFTFGGSRYLNQAFYKTKEWKDVKRKIILRDNGFDLAHPDHQIVGKIIVHHINPIIPEDILKMSYKLFDPENLICCSIEVHNSIHYGFEDSSKYKEYKPRTQYDTCPWR